MKDEYKMNKYVIVFVIVISVIFCLRLVYIRIDNSIRNFKGEYPENVEIANVDDEELQDLVFKTKIGDKYIAIQYVDSALGGKSIIRVMESDNEIVWIPVSEPFTVNNGYEVTQINGIIFINNKGIISYGEQNSILLYSVDNGKTFQEAQIELPDNIFIYEMEDVPYFEDGVYKFKSIDEDGNFVTFESVDGISDWKLI